MSPSPIPISVLDLSIVTPGTTQVDALAESLEAARQADALGFHRIWFSEHHLTPGIAGHSPEVLIAAAAAMTQEIRVGSGAVLLNHYSPLKVAEQFKVMHAMFPDRIDLGLGRSTSGPVVDRALQVDRRSRPADDHPQRVMEVLAWLHDAFEDGHPFAGRPLMPTVPGAPDTWLLGSSPSSCTLAAQLGIPYTFATFINPALAAPALQHYRSAFAPTGLGPDTARAMLAVNVTVADTDEEAQWLALSVKGFIARLMRGQEDLGVPTPEVAAAELSREGREEATWIVADRWPRFVAGDPEVVRTTLERMIQESGADELIVQDLIADATDRRHSQTLVASAFDLAPRGLEATRR